MTKYLLLVPLLLSMKLPCMKLAGEVRLEEIRVDRERVESLFETPLAKAIEDIEIENVVRLSSDGQEIVESGEVIKSPLDLAVKMASMEEGAKQKELLDDIIAYKQLLLNRPALIFSEKNTGDKITATVLADDKDLLDVAVAEGNLQTVSDLMLRTVNDYRFEKTLKIHIAYDAKKSSEFVVRFEGLDNRSACLLSDAIMRKNGLKAEIYKYLMSRDDINELTFEIQQDDLGASSLTTVARSISFRQVRVPGNLPMQAPGVSRENRGYIQPGPGPFYFPTGNCFCPYD